MEKLRLRFKIDLPDTLEPMERVFPSRNVRSTRAKKPVQYILTVRKEGGIRIPPMTLWGLIPHSSPDASGIPGMKPLTIATAERVRTAPMFKHLYRSRRCLIPADGFCEYQDNDGFKKKFSISKPGDELFAFAGIWDRWVSKDETEVFESAALLTTSPHDSIANIHRRMPVIVPERLYDAWLEPSVDPLDEILEIDHSEEGRLQGVAVSN